MVNNIKYIGAQKNPRWTSKDGCNGTDGCVISGISEEILLEVAHIKPVSKCDTEKEKVDINNTLLLWIDIHKYFDTYMISINPKTTKVEVKCDYLMKYNGIKINVNEQTKKYLKNHYSTYCS